MSEILSATNQTDPTRARARHQGLQGSPRLHSVARRRRRKTPPASTMSRMLATLRALHRASSSVRASTSTGSPSTFAPFDGWMHTARGVRSFHASPRAFDGKGDRESEDATSTSSAASSSGEPGVSPLRQAPAPTNALRGAFIPGALTDEGISESASAILRGAKGSPKKFSAFLRLIRGLRADDALIQCDMSPKRVAKTVAKVLQSAIGNAVNNQGLDRERLVVSSATVGKGEYLRRVSIHGRGRAGVMHRPRSHVRVTVEETDAAPTRTVEVFDDEMPWERRRRLGRAKQAIAEAAGIV